MNYNYRLLFGIGFLLFSVLIFGQHAGIPNLPVLPVPNTAQLPNYTDQSSPFLHIKNQVPTPVYPLGPQDSKQQQNQTILKEVAQHGRMREQRMNEVRADIAEMQSTISYRLPVFSDKGGRGFYRQVFDRINVIDSVYSIRDTNFLIENAFFENKLDKNEFDKAITNSRQFLIAKMKELGYDRKSNAAKNFMLFQFFSETLQLKDSKEKHLPFQYDFEDYMGIHNYSKMFVTKLIRTGSGQCHSMPLLYLILAEEIGAEAYLALSPNHSYIRFPDDKGKWYTVELTNGMFSTESYILQSGYVKSEALQNRIYMENLTKKELLSKQLSDLAEGYIHKFGYDEFAQEIINKALELYPNSISAHMINANLATARVKYVVYQLGIDTSDARQREKILQYPKGVQLLKQMHRHYVLIDNLGYEHMPEAAYQQWLQSMKDEKQKKENEAISKQFKGVLTKPTNQIKN